MQDRTGFMLAPEEKVEDFLTYPAIQRKVAVSTQTKR